MVQSQKAGNKLTTCRFTKPAKEKQIVTERNGRKSSKLLVEFKAKTVKDKIPLRNQVRENRNSRGAVNVCDDEGSTRVAEFPQSCRHRKRKMNNQIIIFIYSSLHVQITLMYMYCV
ncbi:uncharacterized protein LOC144656478 [Oculina patagonica]